MLETGVCIGTYAEQLFTVDMSKIIIMIIMIMMIIIIIIIIIITIIITTTIATTKNKTKQIKFCGVYFNNKLVW